MQQNWLLTAVAIDNGSSATTVGAVSAFLVERCGRCTRWQTAGGPGRYTDTGHGTGRVASAGRPSVRRAGRWVMAGTWPPPGVSMASRLLLVCSCSPGSLPLWFSVNPRLLLQTVAERGFFSFIASVRELAAPTAGIVVVVVLFWGRLGLGLGIPRPDFGCRFTMQVTSGAFSASSCTLPCSGVDWVGGLVVSFVVFFSSGGLWL